MPLSMSGDCCSSDISRVAENFPASNGFVCVRIMASGTQSRSSTRSGRWLLTFLAGKALLFVVAEPSAAPLHGIPPSVTSIQNHFPPYLPNIPPSVTSLGPRGGVGRPAFPVYPAFPGHFGQGFRNRNGFRNGYGYTGGAWIAPYYIPDYDTSSGYDPGAGPYMYSGPPAEQTLHVVVDLPTARHGMAEDDEDSAPARATRDNAMSPPDAKAVDATVLVFRDGHKQEVSNYAIMGQTVYVFDNRTQKIALTDLDVAATVKLNDDRGVDFHVPLHAKSYAPPDTQMVVPNSSSPPSRSTYITP